MEIKQNVELEPLDTSDLDNWVGVPLGIRQPKEPFSVNDIRRFVMANYNPNPLYFDEEYAAQSPFGRIVAPQSFLGGGSGTGATPSIQGKIPGSHMLFGGDEFWFYGPRIYPGDLLRLDGMMFDYKVTNTSFAGPTVFTRGDTTYVNQRGEFIAKQRSTSIRYLVSNAQKLGAFKGLEKEPEWTDDQLEEIERQKLEYVASFLGHAKRLYSSVNIGDKLPLRVIGPHTIQSFTTEQRADAAGAWGASYVVKDLPATEDVGWLPEMSRNEQLIKKNPEFGDGLFYGAARGHTQAKYANRIGMPRGYGYGASMGVWVVDYLTNWAGEWGFLRHCRTRYSFPALTGDVAYLTGTVTNKWINKRSGKPTVQVSYEMKNQNGDVMASGIGEIELPED